MVDIFGTLGPSCSDSSTLQKMFKAGMTGMRLNLSHTMLAQNRGLIENVKLSAKTAGIEPKLLIDLQGPELRIGDLEEDLYLNEGDILFLMDNNEKSMVIRQNEMSDHNDYGLRKSIVHIVSPVLSALAVGDEVLFDDGKIKATVTEKTQMSAKLSISRGGILKSRKSILIIDKTVSLPTLTNEDIININEAVSLGITGVMLPFVRGREDIITLRNALDEAGGQDIEIYAKIENLAGVQKLREFIEDCDEIVIARGDLGNAIPLWKLPGLQKDIAAICNTYNRRFTVVTQMLSSMEHAPVPTRAEVSDIYNAVLDGAASVMVTGETAVGDYPVDVINYLYRTSSEAEKKIGKI